MDSMPRPDEHISRRRLLQWIGGVSTLLATPGCVRRTREYMIPYDRMPEHLIPGRPISYATAMPWDGYGYGLLAETHMGRPIKIEGNPHHPASLGAADVFAQASVLSLYDPERARGITQRQALSTWPAFQRSLHEFLSQPAFQRPGRMRMLMAPDSSPTLLDLIGQMQRRYPAIIWHRTTPMLFEGERRATQAIFGRAADPLYNFSKANIVLSFDHDFFSMGPGRLNYARAFSQRRRGETDDMNRLYSVHTSPSLVSAHADHRLPVSIREQRSMLAALAQALDLAVPGAVALKSEHKLWLNALIEDLKKNRGRSIVLMDPQQGQDLHDLVFRINAALGNLDETVSWMASALDDPALQWETEQRLLSDMAAGEVDGLFCLGVNPVYHSTGSAQYRESLPRLAFSAQISPYADETSSLVQWHIPQSHYLESWGDIRAFDGTPSIIQPTIEPLFASHSLMDAVQALVPGSLVSDFDRVRDFWRKRSGVDDFERQWASWLQQGMMPRGDRSLLTFDGRRTAAFHPSPPETQSKAAAPGSGADLILRPDPSVWDGTMANNPWLQELPKPFSKLTWDHALTISPMLAEELQVKTGDWVQIAKGEKSLDVPVLILFQQPARTMTLTLGYGRQGRNLLCSGIGVNAFAWRQGSAAWLFEDVGISKLQRKAYPLAFTQTHFTEYPQQELIRKVDWQEFLQDPEQFVREREHDPNEAPTIPVAPHLVLNTKADPLQWGMSIDTSTCIGCNACVVACQAENNIPVVGKEQVQAGRSMHWLRIDNYFEERTADSDSTFQPVPCMHCETAPCEVVCPVGATAHSEQGLNQMTYNRCVGTRYCSNNCPYKVRHFNFYAYAETNTLASLQHNPDVSVRSRGVMEKCTYCVQRIEAVRIQAGREHRPIADGEIQPACAQACPTRAITFGNISDPQSRVSQDKASRRRYDLLGELNTRPRTTYLAQLKNFSVYLKKMRRRAGL